MRWDAVGTSSGVFVGQLLSNGQAVRWLIVALALLFVLPATVVIIRIQLPAGARLVLLILAVALPILGPLAALTLLRPRHDQQRRVDEHDAGSDRVPNLLMTNPDWPEHTRRHPWEPLAIIVMVFAVSTALDSQ